MANGYPRDLLPLLYPASAFSTVRRPDLARSLKRVGGKVESSFFILYTQAFSGGSLNLRQHAVVASRLLSGGGKTRGPAIDRSSRRDSGPAHLRPGPSRPRFIQVCVLGHRRALPSHRSDGGVFLLRPAAPGRKCPEGPASAFRWPPFFPPRHAHRHLRDVLEGLAGAPPWAQPWRTGGRWSRGGRRHAGASLAGKESLRNGPVARLVAASRARAPGVRRIETEAAPGPLGSPGAGRGREGPGAKKAALRARCALSRN